jgi:hypothetical protein
MKEAGFHVWQPAMCATIREVCHGTAERVLESFVCRETFEFRHVEAAAVCREAQAPLHGREMQLAAAVPQGIQRL